MSGASPAPGAEVCADFGEIDIYLFDQLLRGRFDRRPRVLDGPFDTGDCFMAVCEDTEGNSFLLHQRKG